MVLDDFAFVKDGCDDGGSGDSGGGDAHGCAVVN